MEVLLIADALGAVVNHLTNVLGVPFSSETPTTVPEVYGRVQHLQGTRADLVLDTQPLHVRVWASTAYNAWITAQQAHAVICALEGVTVDGVLFLAAEADLPAWFPDPDTSGPSYIFTAIVTTEAVESSVTVGSP